MAVLKISNCVVYENKKFYCIENLFQKNNYIEEQMKKNIDLLNTSLNAKKIFEQIITNKIELSKAVNNLVIIQNLEDINDILPIGYKSLFDDAIISFDSNGNIENIKFNISQNMAKDFEKLKIKEKFLADYFLDLQNKFKNLKEINGFLNTTSGIITDSYKKLTNNFWLSLNNDIKISDMLTKILKDSILENKTIYNNFVEFSKSKYSYKKQSFENLSIYEYKMNAKHLNWLKNVYLTNLRENYSKDWSKLEQQMINENMQNLIVKEKDINKKNKI